VGDKVQRLFATETALLDLVTQNTYQLLDTGLCRGVIEIMDFEPGLGESVRQKPHRHGRAPQAMKDYNLAERLRTYSQD